MPERRLTILGSSTRQWNPGDEFIMNGVRNLISPMLTGNWLLWNRNPDLFVNTWADTHHREPLIGNYVSSLSAYPIDIVILCGSPEWLGNSVKPIYDHLYTNPHIPLIAIGVGSGGPDLNLSALERTVLDRPNSLVITRSSELAKALNSEFQENKAVYLPCPSIFCSIPELTEVIPQKKIGVICQTPGTDIHAKQEDFFGRIADCIDKTNLPVDVIAFYSGEYPHLVSRFGSDRVRYEMDSWNVLSCLKNYRCIISTRLHGAIGAAVTGTPAILIAEDDFRIETTARLVEEVLPHLSIEEAFKRAEYISPLAVRNHRRRIINFQAVQKARYEVELKAFLKANLP